MKKIVRVFGDPLGVRIEIRFRRDSHNDRNDNDSDKKKKQQQNDYCTVIVYYLSCRGVARVLGIIPNLCVL